MFADIPQRRSAKERVHEGVQGHVGVAVPQQAQPVRNGNAAQEERPVFRKAVHIVPGSYAKLHLL